MHNTMKLIQLERLNKDIKNSKDTIAICKRNIILFALKIWDLIKNLTIWIYHLIKNVLFYLYYILILFTLKVIKAITSIYL